MFYPPKAPFVRPIGRTLLRDDDVLCLSYGYSGIEFAFCGTKVSVTLESNFADKPAGEYGFPSYLGVYVDGVEQKRISPRQSREEFVLYESDTPRSVTVTLCKLSEEHVSRVAIVGVCADTEVTATPAKERRIEVVGDSITCGFGIEVPQGGPGGFDTAVENAYEAWAGTLSRLLDADLCICARSGVGVYSCYSDGETRSTWASAKGLYEQFCPSWNAALHTDYKRDDAYAPQAVILNLGTNDFSYTRDIPERQAAFEDAYAEFLHLVRAHNPEAQIFCMLGSLNFGLWEQILNAVRRVEAEGDAGLHTLKLDCCRPEDGCNATGHPMMATQKRMAETAAPFIRSVMHW